MNNISFVIPAKAGIHALQVLRKVTWMPAYAGMILLLLSACSEMDLQNVSAAQKPEAKTQAEASKIGLKNTHVMFYSEGNANHLAAFLRTKLNHISPAAVEAVSVELPASQLNNTTYKASVTRAISQLRYNIPVAFELSSARAPYHGVVHVTHHAYIVKDCPNWSGSSSQNVANEKHSNFGCATSTNLGLMLVDPRDLERGSGGNIMIDGERAADAVRKYRSSVADGDAASPTPDAGTGN